MSTIKVDTIATRTGSGNITLSNNVASLTSAGAISGTNLTASGTLGVTGASTLTGGLQTGSTAGVSSAPIVTVISSGNSLEWGHSNAAGYRSTLGALSGGGQPFIAWSAEHGTDANLSLIHI